jgi:hypothetical protein
MCYHVEKGATNETEQRLALLRLRRQSKRTVKDNHAAKYIFTTTVLQLHEQNKLFLRDSHHHGGKSNHSSNFLLRF